MLLHLARLAGEVCGSNAPHRHLAVCFSCKVCFVIFKTWVINIRDLVAPQEPVEK